MCESSNKGVSPLRTQPLLLRGLSLAQGLGFQRPAALRPSTDHSGWISANSWLGGWALCDPASKSCNLIPSDGSRSCARSSNGLCPGGFQRPPLRRQCLPLACGLCSGMFLALLTCTSCSSWLCPAAPGFPSSDHPRLLTSLTLSLLLVTFALLCFLCLYVFTGLQSPIILILYLLEPVGRPEHWMNIPSSLPCLIQPQ